MLTRAAATRAARDLSVCQPFALVFMSVACARGAERRSDRRPLPSRRTTNSRPQWTSQKVSKLVFDTSVTPRWLRDERSLLVRYQTRDGRRFYIVDPLKKTKAPLFDHAKMAAALTSITRIPYDAQHLPFTQRPVHQERLGIRVRGPGAARRRHRDDEAEA